MIKLSLTNWLLSFKRLFFTGLFKWENFRNSLLEFPKLLAKKKKLACFCCKKIVIFWQDFHLDIYWKSYPLLREKSTGKVNVYSRFIAILFVICNFQLSFNCLLILPLQILLLKNLLLTHNQNKCHQLQFYNWPSFPWKPWDNMKTAS